MEEPTRELQVPVSIYERAEAIASDSGRSAESVIVDGLSLLFGQLAEMALEPEDLKNLADEQLMAVVHQRLAWPLDTRLRELMQLGQMGQVTEEEIDEIEDLVAKYDHQVLLRSEALLQLKRRGRDIDRLLKLGA
ncbi:MAG: hypothetical protein OXG49_08950 [Chloroflexi bacterium]|nr:hypothetical protein [Chloroflexota bacterium]